MRRQAISLPRRPLPTCARFIVTRMALAGAFLFSGGLLATEPAGPLGASLGDLVTARPAVALESPTLTIKNNRFEPTEIRVPAGKRVTVYIVNEDASPEEFESYSLKVEKIIPAKSKGLVRIGPLEKGRYEFFGDFHQDTAKGAVIAE